MYRIGSTAAEDAKWQGGEGGKGGIEVKWQGWQGCQSDKGKAARVANIESAAAEDASLSMTAE